MNVFHWHISDSQSFPLELPSLPEFSRYGAYSAAQVYTPAQVREVVSYARDRGVRVIPELDAPAHVGNILISSDLVKMYLLFVEVLGGSPSTLTSQYVETQSPGQTSVCSHPAAN